MMGKMWALVVAVGVGLAPAVAAQGRLHPRWEIPGLDFRPNGAWRVRARAIAAHRAALMARGQYGALNAPLAAGPSGAPVAEAFSGVLKVPAVLFNFKSTNLPVMGRDTSDYTALLFSSSPPLGRPYTLRTFYEQLSNNLVSIQGEALGYAQLDSDEVTYTGTPPCAGNPYPGSSSCNGLFPFTSTQGGALPLTRMQNGLREALAKIEATTTIDWSQYDSDHDGYVDLVIFIQPLLDGACGPAANNHLWSHRFFLQGTPYVTKTPDTHNGGFIKISDYTLQSGVGGDNACDANTIMPIGTATHETGHAFSLPDLYDVSELSEGVGEWSLMGSGNYSDPDSPSRMDAWSLSFLGWVNVVPITAGGTYAFGPAPTSDTTFLLRARGANPRGEYFLLENRQAVLADTAVITKHCLVSYYPASPPPSCGGGLMVWHIDSMQVTNAGFNAGNTVNVGSIHGVELEQADGLANLDAMPGSSISNRGDAGDPYPGITGNVRFGPTTTPAALKNAGGFAGFTLDSITQLSPAGAMSFAVRFGTFTTVTSNDPLGAVITLDTVSAHSVQALLDSGSTHTVAVADTQVRADSLVRYVFQSWSDGGQASHTLVITGSSDSVSAMLAFSFRVAAQFDTGGTLTASPGVLTGAYFAPGTPVSVVAHAHAGQFFLGWSGDTAATDTALALTLSKPYRVKANFSGPLPVAAVVEFVTGVTNPLTVAQQQYFDLFGNKNGVPGDVGDFLAWVRATHPTPPASAPLAFRTLTPGSRP